MQFGRAEKNSIGVDYSQSIRKNAPHPLSRKGDSPEKVANTPNIISKKPSPPKTLDTTSPVKQSKLSNTPISPIDPSPQVEVESDIAPKITPPIIPTKHPRTAGKLKEKETKENTPTVNMSSQHCNDKNKIDNPTVPTPYPALPIVHREKKGQSSLTES